jgi:hypothetical protein
MEMGIRLFTSVPDSRRPFSVESFRWSVASLPSRTGMGDFDTLVRNIHAIATRGKRMLELTRSLASRGRDHSSDAADSVPCTLLPAQGAGSGARGGTGGREPSLA